MHTLHKRDVSGSAHSSTLDPLLVNIFAGADQIPAVSAETTTIKVPKPKPVFNDGQKLVTFFAVNVTI